MMILRLVATLCLVTCLYFFYLCYFPFHIAYSNWACSVCKLCVWFFVFHRTYSKGSVILMEIIIFISLLALQMCCPLPVQNAQQSWVTFTLIMSLFTSADRISLSYGFNFVWSCLENGLNLLEMNNMYSKFNIL